MVGTYDLTKQEDFKAVIEFLADLHYGHKGHFFNILTDFGFSNNHGDYRDIRNIVDEGYDEADGEMYYNWYDFDDISQESREYFLGKYYIDYSNDFDRTRDINIRLFLKIENNPMTGRAVIAEYNKLKNITSKLSKDYNYFCRKLDEINLVGKSEEEKRKLISTLNDYKLSQEDYIKLIDAEERLSYLGLE